MQNARSQSGYSLIEMLVIVSIMGLVLVVGAPRMAGYMQGQRLSKGLDELASHLDLARQRAVAENNAFRVILDDPADGQYWLHSDRNGNDVVDGGEPTFGPYTLPRGVFFSSVNLLGDGGLVFLTSGMLRTGEGGTVTLGDERGQTKTLEVFGSGLVSPQ